VVSIPRTVWIVLFAGVAVVAVHSIIFPADPRPERAPVVLTVQR
jgi:hypothetical protein